MSLTLGLDPVAGADRLAEGEELDPCRQPPRRPGSRRACRRRSRGPGGEPASVGTEGDARDHAYVANRKLSERRALPHVPQPHRPVVAGRGKRPPIRAEGDAPDLARVPAEGLAERYARPRVLQPDRASDVGGGERAPVRTQSDGPNAFSIPAQNFLLPRASGAVLRYSTDRGLPRLRSAARGRRFSESLASGSAVLLAHPRGP